MCLGQKNRNHNTYPCFSLVKRFSFIWIRTYVYSLMLALSPAPNQERIMYKSCDFTGQKPTQEFK